MHELPGEHAFTKFEPPISPLERVLQYTDQVAFFRNLDDVTSQRLAQFAQINYRVGEIRRDFRGTTLPKNRYSVKADDLGKAVYFVITREHYANHLRTYSSMAFEIYSDYLSRNENLRTAAREVQNLVDDFLK